MREGRFKTGSLYTILNRMEERGDLSSTKEHSEEGRTRRVYIVTDEGRPKELMLKRGLSMTYENAVWCINELPRDNGGWFRTTYYEGEERDIIHLSHNQVVGWSIFPKEYIGASFKEVIGIIPDAEVVGSSVTFTINKSKIKRDKMS